MGPRRPPPLAVLLLAVALVAACSAEPSDQVGTPGTTTPGDPETTPAGAATTASADAGGQTTGRALVTAPSVRPLVPSTATTTDPAETPFADLQVGDCVDLPGLGLPETVEVETALRRDCAEPHGVEIYAAGSVEEDPAVEYPGDEAVVEAADQLCLESFATYVGVEYVDSALEVLHLRPDEAAWSRGDRTIHCGVYDPTQEPLVGSVQGTAR